MKNIEFRVWHIPEKKMYFRGYQKFFHVLLCQEDRESSKPGPTPVAKAAYKDCVFLESTGLRDKAGREIFEGDRLRVRVGDRTVEGVLEDIPDSFGNKNAHPLSGFLKQHGLSGHPHEMEIEILGNEYETPV